MVSRYLIGKGELLTHAIPAPKRGMGEKRRPYTLAENQLAVLPQVDATARLVKDIPDTACASDVAVVKMTLHPAFMARSWFPAHLLRESHLVSVGSKTVRIRPRKTVGVKAPAMSDTTQLLVAGSREALARWGEFSRSLQEDTAPGMQFAEIESVGLMAASDRIASDGAANGSVFEVGLHIWPDMQLEDLRAHFKRYAKSCGFTMRNDLEFITGRMLFVPVAGDPDGIEKLAAYTLLRVVRHMPRLRGVPAPVRSHTPTISFRVPNVIPFSREPKVAVLDGGLPDEHVLGGFINRYFKADPAAADVESYLDHGLAVTSALLFGPLEPGTTAPRPYAFVDHHRVLDAQVRGENPYELYRTLGHIETILLSRQYQFLNLSLGPELPLEDADVHAWTAVLDRQLSSGETLLTVAVGNNGQADRRLHLDRIQVPSDAVNAVAVGATSRTNEEWERASYSARGPGRQPGRRKPDLVAFGGSAKEYFHVAARGRQSALRPETGTSFAAPNALRMAVGIRSILGAEVYPLTIRALLIHATEPHEKHVFDEHGWGRVTGDINGIITCGDGVARIIYQGTLRPGKFLRAPVPLPTYAFTGKVYLRATFCYATHVDPQDSAAYTKSGLVITFRPHSGKKAPGKANAATKTFFPVANYRPEAELRSDLGKWEPTLHAELGFLGSSLKEPVFDIHHLARDGGGAPGITDDIPYALVLTLTARNHPTVYEDILAAHQVLQTIEPAVTVPITI